MGILDRLSARTLGDMRARLARTEVDDDGRMMLDEVRQDAGKVQILADREALMARLDQAIASKTAERTGGEP